MTATAHPTTTLALSAALSMGLSQTVVAAEVAVIAPVTQVVPSPLNPRKDFGAQALTELAASIHEKTVFAPDGSVLQTGVTAPLICRLTPDGKLEIADGERRYRAVTKLIEEGVVIAVADGTDSNARITTRDVTLRLPADYPVPVVIRALTDAELVDLATTANLMRDDLSFVETADAMLSLKGGGWTLEQVSVKFGKHPREVQAMMQFASGLGRDGRRALGSGKINLEQARVIASLTGAMKEAALKQATQGYSATQLRNTVRSAGFLVENAEFDVEASGLAIDEGLLMGIPARFADVKAALDHQIKWAQGRAESFATKGIKAEVLVMDGTIFRSSDTPYSLAYGNEYKAATKTLIVVMSGNGKVEVRQDMIHTDDKKRIDAEQRKASRTQAPKKQEGSIRDGGRRLAHQARAAALDARLARDPRECLVAVISDLIASHECGGRHLTTLRRNQRKSVPVQPETLALADQIAARFPDVFTQSESQGLRTRHPYGGSAHVRAALRAEGVTLDDVLMVFTYYTHNTAGNWETDKNSSVYGLKDYAGEIGADEVLKARFDLTAEYLSAYTLADLSDLIATMPDVHRPALKPAQGKKEVIALILSKKDALRAAGWVPDLVQFQ